MNKSYLYFQGPPGVGKTYTAGFISLELLKKSKKIPEWTNKNKKNDLESHLDFLSTFLTKITPKRAPKRDQKRRKHF